MRFETSLSGVFAIGDIRSGLVKRVAAAVGEGAAAMHYIHEHLRHPEVVSSLPGAVLAPSDPGSATLAPGQA